jgi:hypothetical protein
MVIFRRVLLLLSLSGLGPSAYDAYDVAPALDEDLSITYVRRPQEPTALPLSTISKAFS